VPDWRDTRRLLNSRRHELASAAAQLYPQALRVASTPLLARPEWIPPAPLDLDEVALTWVDTPPPGADVTGAASAHVRPSRPHGGRYASYADALAEIERPALLENRPIYRLLSASLTGRPPLLALTPGRYFDWVNGGEAMAHEFAAASLPGGKINFHHERLRLRTLVGDPGDLAGRSALCAVSTLTLRIPPVGDPTFVLHWRDPAAVTHAGGLYQVMPVGVFQPAADGAQAQARDLDLWRCMAREFHEEFLGAAEDYRGPADYARRPFFAELAAARAAGKLRVWCLGLGADPLTLAVDILCVAAFSSDVFDALFTGLVAVNAEGRVRAGVPFTAEMVDRLTGREPMQPAGAAVLGSTEPNCGYRPASVPAARQAVAHGQCSSQQEQVPWSSRCLSSSSRAMVRSLVNSGVTYSTLAVVHMGPGFLRVPPPGSTLRQASFVPVSY
jgi:hypothetical protein